MDGDGTYDGAMMALGQAIQAIINLSCTWFIVYVLLGSLVKVGLIRFMNKNLEPRSRRFWPVFLSHFIFSILFMNPYTLVILYNRSEYLREEILIWLIWLIYLIILPVLLDILFLRIIPRMKLFRWLLWTPPLKQVIIINVVICLVSYIAAVLVARS